MNVSRGDERAGAANRDLFLPRKEERVNQVERFFSELLWSGAL
jgi:hypothetical protein